VFKLRSVRSIVITPARTGKERRSNKAVIPTDQINKGTRSKGILKGRIFIIVVIKLRAPRMEDTPAR
jgi:hypothetical protein